MLYHVSTDLSQVTQVFTPRIPNREQRMEGENDYIPRICVAKSIADCLTAMPNGGYLLENSDKPNRIRVYEFEETTIVKKENLVTPADLYFSEWVLDAWVTGEYWVIEQQLIPKKHYDLELDSFEVIDGPFISPSDFKKAYLQSGNPEEILDELEEKAEKCIARITELKFHKI